uniref:Uncharacterized protein n=1 Tax=Arundo donax TaxID=35708 RepID=A0A0A9DAT0_ARUDO
MRLKNMIHWNLLSQVVKHGQSMTYHLPLQSPCLRVSRGHPLLLDLGLELQLKLRSATLQGKEGDCTVRIICHQTQKTSAGLGED